MDRLCRWRTRANRDAQRGVGIEWKTQDWQYLATNSHSCLVLSSTVACDRFTTRSASQHLRSRLPPPLLRRRA
jgi:hypothetical protein